MTTLNDVKTIFDAQYNRQCRMRNITPEVIGAGEFKLWYEIISDRLFRDLNITDLSTTISLTPVTVFTEYALPSTFGGLRGYELSFSNSSSVINNLDIVEIGNIPRLGSLAQGIPNKMSIYTKSDGLFYVTLYPLVANSGSLRIMYKRLTEIGNAVSTGGVGTGTATSLTGTVELPIVYQHLLLYGILAQVFPDLEGKFEAMVARAIYDRPNPNKGGLSYNLGGLDDEDIDNGFSKNFNGEV